MNKRQRLKQIIREEVRSVLNELTGREYLAPGIEHEKIRELAEKRHGRTNSLWAFRDLREFMQLANLSSVRSLVSFKPDPFQHGKVDNRCDEIAVFHGREFPSIPYDENQVYGLCAPFITNNDGDRRGEIIRINFREVSEGALDTEGIGYTIYSTGAGSAPWEYDAPELYEYFDNNKLRR
jgi:hypothetical protein